MSKDFIRWIRSNILILVGLSLLGLLVFSNTLGSSFVADDIAGIAQNQQLADFKIVTTNPLFFVQPLFYFLIVRLFDGSAFVFHLQNLIFHILTVIMVYVVVSLITNKKAALFASILFAIHPLISESVAWISAGNYIKGTFFALSSFACYLGATKTKRSEFTFFSLILFLIALASSTQAVVLPFILLSYEFLFGNIKKKKLLLSLFFLLSTVYVVMYFGAIPSRISSLSSISEPASRFYNPLVQIPRAISTYISLAIFPHTLTLNYTAATTSNQLVMWYTILVLFIITLLFTFKKNQYIFFFLSFYIFSLLPTLLPIRIASVVAERYAYFGAVGLFFPIGYTLSKIKNGWIPLFIIAVLFAGRTYIRNRDWTNQQTLWTKTVITSPLSFSAHYNLAGVYILQSNWDGAIDELQKTIKLAPNFAEAYVQLGVCYRKKAEVDLAMASYIKAIQLNSNSWVPYQNLAALYFERQRFKDAEQVTLRAIQLNPTSSGLYRNLGMIYEAMGDMDKANAAYDQSNVLMK